MQLSTYSSSSVELLLFCQQQCRPLLTAIVAMPVITILTTFITIVNAVLVAKRVRIDVPDASEVACLLQGTAMDTTTDWTPERFDLRSFRSVRFASNIGTVRNQGEGSNNSYNVPKLHLVKQIQI